MLLEKEFYSIINQDFEEGRILTTLRINSENEIFKGHFPGNPIVPGVCMLQMVRELMESKIKCSLMIQEVSNMKFIAAYNPLEQDVSEMSITYLPLEYGWKITASLTAQGTIFFKLNAIFK